jgi:ribose transport system permease protein
VKKGPADSQMTKISRSILRESIVLPPLIGLILLVVMASVLSPYFMTFKNIINVLRQVSIVAIISVGMTYVIITGGIDLSVGSVAALSGMVTGMFLKNVGAGLFVSISMGMMSGILCGLFSGFLITSKIRMPPFISTLAMMSIARGIALMMTSGRPIFNLPESFSFLGGGFFWRIPIPIIIMLVIYLFAHISLTYTKSGLYFYAVGGNEEAARVTGIKNNVVKMRAYLISGFCASIAGIVLTSRVMVSEPIAGFLYELEAIAAVIIGGANLFGGEGIVLGTLIGAVIMGVLRNSLNLLNVSTYLQQVVVGFVIVTMVSISILRRR